MPLEVLHISRRQCTWKALRRHHHSQPKEGITVESLSFESQEPEDRGKEPVEESSNLSLMIVRIGPSSSIQSSCASRIISGPFEVDRLKAPITIHVDYHASLVACSPGVLP